ncbi:MAG: AAA family ATPase [Chloroflexi bacterium RBG_16_57_11]|nr:MAG: AAA family ATPase [Chloroflexi bacterium RBG_16_57_11]
MQQQKITDDLHALLEVLPAAIARAVTEANDSDNLLEVILDLGRLPTARFVTREVLLSKTDVPHQDIDYVVERIGEFDADNRAGLERTLHRISAIRNRRGYIVGLTCRVGRAVYGTTDIIKDLIESGKSLLILGRPGVGKTTMLREAARILAETKRVVIVDTSNEIGGDGDVPHPAVGHARRMQVATPSLQHEVMIEAVENHNPEAIVIDEIGRELEAAAARTIAERGVQLIGTAHGNSLENLLLNPTLADLVGGIESVTLSDEEARRRGTQKTVLERRSPPTFDVLIEIQTRDRLAVHPDVAAAVDGLLRGYPLPPEIRSRINGEIRIERAPAPTRPAAFGQQGYRRQGGEALQERSALPAYRTDQPSASSRSDNGSSGRDRSSLQTVRIYPYGVARNRLSQAARRLGVPALIVDEAGDANVLVTLRAYYRKRQRTITEAEQRNVPIYVLRSNTVNQMLQFLGDLFNLYADESGEAGMDTALQETRAAINAVMNGERWVELQPAASSIRRVQHQMARDANLVSHSYGKEPNRRVRIYREG